MKEDDMADRPLPPRLEFADPPCSICGEDTDLGDGAYYCTRCDASWDAETADQKEGEWDDTNASQCASEMRPYADGRWKMLPEAMRECTYRCVLDAGHRKRHLHPDWQRGWVNHEASHGA
jgi:hypothetical protein